MPKEFGGYTELGSALNRISSKQDDSRSKKIKVRWGLIVKSENGLYKFFVDLYQKGKKDGASDGMTTKAIPIAMSTDLLTLAYGEPKKLEGRFRVKIEYSSSSVNDGEGVALERLTTKTLKGNQLEVVQQANELATKGYAFAPPGAGLNPV